MNAAPEYRGSHSVFCVLRVADCVIWGGDCQWLMVTTRNQ